jgi:glycosyltransferase involved in cell wall biosynthesis
MTEAVLPISDITQNKLLPAVSIIVPAYNVTKYIAETLDSILAQTFKDYEIIVVNDGSPDTEDLERVLSPYMNQIVYIKQRNKGLSGARNTAIQAARGELIALLDADDKWMPDYLEVHYQMMKEDPTIDVVYSDAIIFGEALDFGQRYMDICPSDGEVTFESVATQRCNVMVSATIRRETVIKAGMFDETLRSAEDFDLWLRILKKGGRIVYHNQPLVFYRRRPGSLSSNPLWMSEHGVKVLEKLKRTLSLTEKERQALNEQIARFKANANLFEGKKAFFEGDSKTAIKKLEEANKFLKDSKISLVLILLKLAPRFMLWLYNLRDRFIFETSTKF